LRLSSIASISCPTIVIELGKLISSYFTTIPDGRVAGLYENKANSAHQLEARTGTWLSLAKEEN
jgi:hypothetical protein